MLSLLLLCIAACASAQCCTGFGSNPLPRNEADCISTSAVNWYMMPCSSGESCMSIKCSGPSYPAMYSQFCATQDKVDDKIRYNAAIGNTCAIGTASRTAPTFATALAASLVVFFCYVMN